jgi:hypothetical protein
MDMIRLVSNDISKAKPAERMGLARDAGLVNLFNPSTMIIGGDVALSGDLLITSIRQAIRERSCTLQNKTYILRQSANKRR